MKITYVHHSSFAIEFPESKKVLLFDYFNGELPQWDKDYRIYVFASHKHYDHFSKKIFNFALEYPDITYILAKETRMNEKYMDRWNIPIVARDRINYVGKDREYDFDDIHVTTLTSTDSGVAFIIRTEGKTLYHAGDLNWWWWDQYTPQQSLQMEKDFKAQIDKFDKNLHIDAAFLPLDIRLKEEGFFRGFDYYMRRWDIKMAFPMHGWGRFDAIEKLKAMPVSAEYRDRVVMIHNDGESWEV